MDFSIDEATLLSYIEGTLPADEARQVEEWAESQPEHKKLLEQCYYTAALGQRVSHYEQADTERALTNFRRRVAESKVTDEAKTTGRFGRKMRTAWQRYAAPVAAFVGGVVLTAGILLAAYGTEQTFEASTAMGQRARVILPDGTGVWLNSSTQLTYRGGWLSSERRVDLSGEAYFDVKRNERKPFVVESRGVRTKVLGTKFNVRARGYEDCVVTTLLKGSVQMFCCGDDCDGHFLRPGQTLTVDVRTRDVELNAPSNPEQVLLWIKGELRFFNQSMDDIARTLSRVYNVKFVFADEHAKSEHFTCEFKTDVSLDEVLHTLSLTKHFTYRIEGDEVHIKSVKR